MSLNVLLQGRGCEKHTHGRNIIYKKSTIYIKMHLIKRRNVQAFSTKSNNSNNFLFYCCLPAVGQPDVSTDPLLLLSIEWRFHYKVIISSTLP